ncbi:MAG TPA: flagellar biosynthesis anti-sigma factor FlgM, partial [Pseudomonadales bacterium]
MDVNKLNAPNPLERRARDAELAPARGASEQKASRRADEASASRHDDAVRLSAEARQLREIEHRVSEEEAFDTARVEQIRAAIAEGRYHVDPERLARRFIALES